MFFAYSRYSFSLVMPSFLFDSAIGMGGSHSGGSIEQPMMDREVISISGSSLKDTRCGASDSKSSSSERVRALHPTGGGISRPCEKAQPSTTSGELVPVIVILPPSASGGVRRGSCVEMLGCLPTCDVAIVFGRHCPHILLLAMSK